MVRDCLVLGCRDKDAKAQLFREKDCTLKKALESLQISKSMYEQPKDMGGEDINEHVLAITGMYKTSWFWKKGSIHLQNSAITHNTISCNILLYHDTKEVIYQYTYPKCVLLHL